MKRRQPQGVAAAAATLMRPGRAPSGAGPLRVAIR
jgi:hypothetical protein